MDKEGAQDEERETAEVEEELERAAPQKPATDETEIEFNGFDPDKETEQNQDQEDKKMDSYQPMLSQSKPGRKKLITAAVIIVIVLASTWVIKSFFGGSPESKTKTESQPIQTPIPTPSPTLAVKLERSEWSFEVLNGSGVSGAAKKLADQLKSLGYQVVKAANADKDTYTQNQIYVKAELKDKVDLVIADLKDFVKIASVAGELEDSTASARIIIGKD